MIEHNINEMFLLLHERNQLATMRNKARQKMYYWRTIWEHKKSNRHGTDYHVPKKHKKTPLHKLRTNWQRHKVDFERANLLLMEFTEEHGLKLKRLLKHFNYCVQSNGSAGYAGISRVGPEPHAYHWCGRKEISRKALEYKINKIADSILLKGEL